MATGFSECVFVTSSTSSKSKKTGRVDWQLLQATFEQIGHESRAAGFLLAAELLLFPAFQAPKWAASGRRWAEKAVRAFFDPDLYRGRRTVGQFLADIESIAQNPQRLRIVLMRDRLQRYVTTRCRGIFNRQRY